MTIQWAIQWVDVVAIVVAVGLAALGAWRGLWREILVTLAGIVLGIVMGTLWGEAGAWGVTLDSNAQGFIHLGSLLFIVVFLGYGSALFLPRRRLVWWQHLTGGLVGLLNGLLLGALSIRYIQEYFVKGPSVLQNSLFYSVATRWLPWAFLGIVLALSVAVAAVALVRLARFIIQLTQPAEGEAVPGPGVAAPVAMPAPEPTPAPAPPAPSPEESTVPCPNCGQPVPAGAAYCPQCGKIISC